MNHYGSAKIPVYLEDVIVYLPAFPRLLFYGSFCLIFSDFKKNPNFSCQASQPVKSRDLL